jgi:hypothetical protein
MDSDNKYFETGSNPYYLNLNNTAKDYSFCDSTNPQNGLLDLLSKFIVIENEFQVKSMNIEQVLINED